MEEDHLFCCELFGLAWFSLVHWVRFRFVFLPVLEFLRLSLKNDSSLFDEPEEEQRCPCAFSLDSTPKPTNQPQALSGNQELSRHSGRSDPLSARGSRGGFSVATLNRVSEGPGGFVGSVSALDQGRGAR